VPSSSVRIPFPTPQIPWRGEIWRAHQCAYPADSTGGSRRFAARYNRGADSCPDGTDWDEAYRGGLVWEALYTGLFYGVCLGKLTRHLSPTTLVQKLRALCLTQLRADLAAVLDCTDLAALGLASGTPCPIALQAVLTASVSRYVEAFNTLLTLLSPQVHAGMR